MNEEIVLIYPPDKNIYIDHFNKANNINNKNTIEIDLYNKTDKKVYYKINYEITKNFFIENNSSVIDQYENQNLKIILNNNNNPSKLKLELLFYELNNDINIKQKNIINIINKIQENKENNNYNIYSNFKKELNKINEKIKMLIIKEKNYNKKRKIKFREILALIFTIIFLGFIFGIKLSNSWKKLFNNNINNNNKSMNDKIIDIEVSDLENDEEFEEIQFMTMEERLELKNINEQNIEKLNNLKNFDFRNEIIKSRKLKENEIIKNKSNFSKLIVFKIIYYIIFFTLLYI